MWGYPGKKLLFMGQEFAQVREWSEAARSTGICSMSPHMGMRAWCAISTSSIAAPRAARPRLRAEGFEWLIVDDAENSVFAWLRMAPGAPPSPSSAT
jgi:1,4-alpha-glucan branching enzyme